MRRVQLSIDFLRKLSFLSVALLLSIAFTIGGETAQSKNAFFRDTQQTSVYRVSWSPDGSKVAGASIDYIGGRVWDVASGQIISTL
ncbi:hypothetical protein FBR01_05250 [Anaerolineae bacterium CFX8]|nr:hypothetical protein [Anaerolineae bacterium CFX8]